MSGINFGEMCDEAANRLYLQHYGIKGMKWGIRRFQNVDGTRTAEGKIRYNAASAERTLKKYQNPDGTLNEAGMKKFKSIKDGGRGKAAEGFYKLATGPDTAENYYDLRASAPVQHAVSKMRDDGKKLYEAESKENAERERLIRDGYDNLSADQKKEYYDAAVEYNTYGDGSVEAAKHRTDSTTEWFNGSKGTWQVDEQTAEYDIAGSPYGQYYSKNRDQIELSLSDYKKIAEKAWNELYDNADKYIQEFTNGFGDVKLTDSKYDSSVNSRLSGIIRSTYFDIADSAVVEKVIDNIPQENYEKAIERANEWFTKQRQNSSTRSKPV